MSDTPDTTELLENMTNIDIEEYEDGILNTTYRVRNSVLSNPDDEIDVTAVYENSQPNFKMNGITAGEFINEYITLSEVIPDMMMTNKIYIMTLSPGDKIFFENPMLVLPNCVGFFSDVKLEHTPDIINKIPLRIYTIKDSSNQTKCQIKVNAKYDAKNKEFVNDDDKIKEEIAKCLYLDYIPQIPYIRIVNSKKISDNTFEIYFVKTVQKSDQIKSFNKIGGKNKSRKMNKGYKLNKSYKANKSKKSKKTRKGRKSNGRRKTIKK
jgi:hypothetical protein